MDPLRYCALLTAANITLAQPLAEHVQRYHSQVCIKGLYANLILPDPD